MRKHKNIAALISSLEPSIQQAFVDSLNIVKSDAQLVAIEAALRSGDVNAALNALRVDATHFQPLDDALRAAHIAGAMWAYDQIKTNARSKGVVIVGGYDARNTRAEEIIKRYSSQKIVSISESVREAVRQSFADAIEKGTSPRTAALNIVGRVGPQRVRRGGLLGLDPQKAAWVRNAQQELRQLDPNYLTRKLRDKRYDSLFKRLIKAGTAPSDAEISLMTDLYKNRLLRLRGETIARTEMLSSVHAAQSESLQQLVDVGQLASEEVVVEWDASSDSYTRESHRAADGQRRVQGEPFEVGGYPMLYPGDSTYAPVEEVVNCRCYARVRVDFISAARRQTTTAELQSIRALM